MNAPVRVRPVRATLMLSSLALAAMLSFALPAWAIGPDPYSPMVSIMDVKKGDDKVAPPAPAATGRGTGNNGKGGASGGNNNSSVPKGAKMLSSTKGDLTYIITLRNTGKIPARNVQVEYHFYNKTVVTDNGLSDPPTITDITSTENIDIDPGKMKDVQTQSIPHENTQSQMNGATSGGGRQKVTTSSTYSSSVTSVLGWHIEVRYNDKVLQARDQPDNLQDLLKKYNNSK